MEQVGNLAEEGRTALLKKDHSKLVELMNRNFDLRRRVFEDECLGAIDEHRGVARRVGAASKFTGSGGATVIFCPGGPFQVKILEEECCNWDLNNSDIQSFPESTRKTLISKIY